jgi:hypothetical protein
MHWKLVGLLVIAFTVLLVVLSQCHFVQAAGCAKSCGAWKQWRQPLGGNTPFACYDSNGNGDFAFYPSCCLSTECETATSTDLKARGVKVKIISPCTVVCTSTCTDNTIPNSATGTVTSNLDTIDQYTCHTETSSSSQEKAVPVVTPKQKSVRKIKPVAHY